jgi:uncharacterized protein (DUF58 family)
MQPNDSIADLSHPLRAVSDPAFLSKLHRFRLRVRHSASRRTGNTSMPFAVQSDGMELANHKSYTPGDDLRHFDWNAYGRLDQKLIKTFRAEREAPLHLIIDTSASMGVPAADGKLEFAAALAAGLAYVSLRQHDPVQLVALARERRGGSLAPLFRHPQRLPDLQAILATLRPSGTTILEEGIAAYLRTTRLPGIVIVLSDFLVRPPVYEGALGRLRERGYSVAALRVIGPGERDPRDLPRRVRIRDAETGCERLVDLDLAHRQRYAAALEGQLADLKTWCDRHLVTYALVDTALGLEACLLREMPRAGLLQ